MNVNIERLAGEINEKKDPLNQEEKEQLLIGFLKALIKEQLPEIAEKPEIQAKPDEILIEKIILESNKLERLGHA